MQRHSARWLIALFLLLPATRSQAEVRLPGFFTDHMVLQQGMKIRVWGWGDPGEKVRVELGDDAADAVADADGRWNVGLKARNASKTPHTLRVKGSNQIELKDIVIGEVWLCSGQSNMEWSVAASANAKEEIAAADYPLIRHMKVAHRPSMVPLDDIPSKWERCSPETAGQFTACGYFMARKLLKELDVPIGLINSSWGGTRVEPWTPPIGFERVKQLEAIERSVAGRTPGNSQYEQTLRKHIAATEDWIAKAKKSLDTKSAIAAPPLYPASIAPFRSHQDPTMLYNGMIHALVGYSMRGAIWYQGESNHRESDYFEKKKALINGWRELWGQGDFPFYYVQIAPFQYGNEDPAILARFWEQQARVQELKNAAMVVTNDITMLNDIHPRNKQDVGLRLANLALSNDYGRTDLVARSPELAELKPVDGALELTFKYTGGGLKTRDGKPVTHFEIVGPESNGFQSADAEIDGDVVTLSSDKVKQPVAFRFAWHKLAEPNLTGGTGLPVGAVRRGEVPSFFSQLPVSREYKLVYELDLSNLNGSPTYDIDRSGAVAGFDRVGYLLDLDSRGSGPQSVFVSMGAFTDDIRKIAIPTTSTGAVFQQAVKSMDVFSNVGSIKSGRGIGTGNIEFWPHNYGQGNHAKVQNASSTRYDFGDQMSDPREGYGSMQVHNHGARQTVFAINHWRNASRADIGIGNSPGDTHDWTFTGNAASYSMKRLRVYVRPI